MSTISDDDWFQIQSSYGYFMTHVHFLAAQKVLPSESALLTHQMEYWWNVVHKHRKLRRGYDMIRGEDSAFQYYNPKLKHTVPDKPPWETTDTLDTQTLTPTGRRPGAGRGCGASPRRTRTLSNKPLHTRLCFRTILFPARTNGIGSACAGWRDAGSVCCTRCRAGARAACASRRGSGPRAGRPGRRAPVTC